MSKDNKNMQEIRYPDFDRHTKNFKHKIENKFEEHGNSWLDIDDDRFWKNRLLIEHKKVIEAPTLAEKRDELYDIAVVALMWIEEIDRKLAKTAQNSEVHKSNQK